MYRWIRASFLCALFCLLLFSHPCVLAEELPASPSDGVADLITVEEEISADSEPDSLPQGEEEPAPDAPMDGAPQETVPPESSSDSAEEPLLPPESLTESDPEALPNPADVISPDSADRSIPSEDFTPNEDEAAEMASPSADRSLMPSPDEVGLTTPPHVPINDVPVEDPVEDLVDKSVLDAGDSPNDTPLQAPEEAEPASDLPVEEVAVLPPESEPAAEPEAPAEPDPPDQPIAGPVGTGSTATPPPSDPASPPDPAETAIPVPVSSVPEKQEDPPEDEAGVVDESRDKEDESSREDDDTVIIQYRTPAQAVSVDDGASSSELLNAYAQDALDRLSRPMLYFAVLNTGERLDGIEASLYWQLKDLITEVAEGRRTSGIFQIPIESLDLDQTRWTASELGLDTLTEQDESGNRVFTREALELVGMNMDYDFPRLLSALLSDCPYELYWFDKAVGAVAGGYRVSGNAKYIKVTGSLEFFFAVEADYATGEYSEVSFIAADGTESSLRRLLTVDPKVGAAVRKAVSNAAAIIAEYADEPDYYKLRAYADRICALADYNETAAASSDTRYGNPWQIIWLFDGDPETTLVCESYARALQYLCDNSSFSSDICCWCVSGRLHGETHMWNMVRMNNGKNYLVDLTNGDRGEVVNEDLFLVGSEDGSPDQGYRIVNSSGTIDNRYLYSTAALNLFTEVERTLAPSDYTACDITGEHSPGEPVRENEVPATYEANGSYDLAVYCALCGEELSRSHTVIPKKTLPAPVLTGADSTESGIVLRWEKVPDATGYAVYRKSADDSGWQLLGKTDSLGWLDSSVENGHTYSYTIRATVGSASSDNARSQSVTCTWEAAVTDQQQAAKGPKTGERQDLRLWLLLWLIGIEGLFIFLPVLRSTRRT